MARSLGRGLRLIAIDELGRVNRTRLGQAWDDDALTGHGGGNGDSKQFEGRWSEVDEASTGAKLETGCRKD